MKLRLALPLTLLLATLPLYAAKKEKAEKEAPSSGWYDWRGPAQTGVSQEKEMPNKIDVKNPLWTADFPGQSAPVIANGKLYIMGYLGDGPDLQEGVGCFDADTGKLLWKQLFNDFLSDVVYLRYANSSPSIDAETGNVYIQNSCGIFAAFTGDGKLLWKHSMMEEFGRMTFPNNRTASPLIDHDLVITRGITSAWGAYGAPGDRFYAFDKKTGELVWSSSPGARPQDNTFSHPWLSFLNGKRVFYCACGDSSVVCVNARTGEPLFRTAVAKAGAKGGINSSVVEYKGNIVVTHMSENIDTSDVGRTAAYKIPTEFKPPTPFAPQVFDDKDLEQWRNPAGSLASSPVLVGNRIYMVAESGDLYAIDADSGKTLWKKQLGIEQRQSSPFYADGKLYIAMYIAAASQSGGGDSAGGESIGNGELFVIKPGDKDAEILSRTVLSGKCYGSPVGFNGKIYLQTEKKLYCFGKKGRNPGLAPAPEAQPWPTAGEKKKLQIIPYEIFLNPGQAQKFRIRALDGNGFVAEENVDPKTLKWTHFIPPTALVKSTIKGEMNSDGVLTADQDNVPSAGQFEAAAGDLKGFFKGRILPGIPLKQDFESYELNENTAKPPPPGIPNTLEPPTPFAYPPLPWNAARFKFEIREKGEGNKALVKTIDNKRLQRGTVFINRPDLKNYTMEADVLTEGNKRKMSEIGLVNQRYIINLKGNAQALEVTSNQELFKQSVPFKVTPNVWYHLKTRVDVAADGSGMIRAKAWKRDEPEPEAWTIEVPHKHANEEGSPGIFSFAPQEQRAWIDNIVVTPNK